MYGDPFCEIVEEIEKAASEGVGTPQTFTGLSIDPSGPDVFEFTITVPCDITVSIDPTTGDPYLAGPQNADGSCSAGTLFSPDTQANLDLEVLGPAGSLAVGNVNPVGMIESITVSLPAAGTYQIQVSNNGELGIQGYTMTCSLFNCVSAARIPNMGEWGLICLALCLLIFGIVVIREREFALEA